jgi:PAS domain S-box-containing protein
MIPIVPPAEVEVDDTRRYIWVNDAACELLGYSRDELLRLHIDDIAFPSGAHVKPMYAKFMNDGSMQGIIALKRKSGEAIRVSYRARTEDGRSRATWTHYEVWNVQPPAWL